MPLRWRDTALPALTVAVALAALALVLGWRGGDWPAQLYRIELFQRAGLTQWDNFWYAGHHALGYSVLYPPLGALFGPGVVAVASAAVAAFAFALMADRWLVAPRAASIVFAAGTVTNIAVGRLTFALGLAVGMVAVLAMSTDRRWFALGLAVLTPLASPVAGVFVLLAGVAWAGAARPVRRHGFEVAAGAAIGIAVPALAFPEGGTFPFSLEDCALTAVVGLLALLLPRRYRAVRVGGVLYALGALATYAVPNPLGANVMRLGMYTAAPIAVGVLWPARGRLAAMHAGPLLVWQWLPAADSMFTAGRDPSSVPEYYDGLLHELAARDAVRVEIPFTLHHWETTYVAPAFALARGWERQVDIGVNPLFYDGTLSAVSYEHWLRDDAVGYVALPDAPLDDSATAEAQLVRGGLPNLDRVWHDDHWQLFRVVDARPLVEGDADLVDMDADSFRLRVRSPGDVLVRIRFSSHWDVDGPGCAVPTEDGWTLIRFPQAGTWRVRQVVSRWIPFEEDQSDECPLVP
jgi:hypothetical protein